MSWETLKPRSLEHHIPLIKSHFSNNFVSIQYLLFFNSSNFIYTASIGKYYKRYWFNLSTFLTPQGTGISSVSILKSRYYMSDSDFIMLALGTGVSPDDNNNNFLMSKSVKSKNAAINLHSTFKKNYILLLSASLNRQEIKGGSYLNQYTLGIGLDKQF